MLHDEEMNAGAGMPSVYRSAQTTDVFATIPE